MKRARPGAGGIRRDTDSARMSQEGVDRAVAWVRRRCGWRAELGLVLGSGFQGLAEEVEVAWEMEGKAMPGFPATGVSGHAGRLLAGRLHGVPVWVLSGRAHYYEGYSLGQVTWPIRVLAGLGVRDLILTNAAGGMARHLVTGGFMLIRDHINAMGANPLRGWTPVGQERFVDLSQVYDGRLRSLFLRAARRVRCRLPEGVYLAVSGPSYETPAEIRAFAKWGADAVGMSTVPEAIVARQGGMRVAGLSCISNPAAGRSRGPLSHEEVLRAGQRADRRARALMRAFVELYETTILKRRTGGGGR